MKKLLLLILFTLALLVSNAQKQANMWYFGNTAAVSFNSGSPVAFTGSAMNTNEGCASIADKTSGALLFYTDGTTVYNKNNVSMTNGTGLTGNTSSTQSAVIVPVPGSNTLFYVFTVDAQAGFYTGNNGDFSYNIVDMTMSGGLGAVTTKNVVLRSSMTEKIAAVRACNGKDIWVIAHEWNSNAFYAYRVSAGGISAPVVTNTGIVHQNAGSINNAETIGYMKCSPDGKKLAVACYFDLNTVQIFDFDANTGIVSNPATDTNFPNVSGDDGPYGATFSPDNSRLYIGVWKLSNPVIYQYNMLAGSNAAIIASKTLISTAATGFYGALQIGPDGKIYVSHSGTSYLDVINNPNALGAACNYVSNAVALAGSSTPALGLPDIVESFLIAPYTGKLTYTDCNGTHADAFSDTTLNGTITCLWDFGDPASGANDSSTLQNPTHTFSSAGSFIVKLHLTNACGTDTLVQTINVSTGGAAAAAYPADTAFCEGDFAQLQATGGTTYKWSPGAGLSDSTIANPVAYPSVSTTYTVTVYPPPCTGDSTATVNITVNPAPPVPDIIQSGDTLYCSADTSYRTYQWYFQSNMVPGAVNSWFVADSSGNYNLAVTNIYRCIISVGINITGVKNYSSDKFISVAPNPAKDKLFVNGSSLTGRATMKIYNVIGEVLLNDSFADHDIHKKAYDIAFLPAGIYFVEFVMDKERSVVRFVKE